jgi:TonB family protein
MKRFLLISILLHGIFLLFCFSWEIPLPNKLSSRGVIEVSLVEKIYEEKAQKTLPSLKKEKKKAKIEETREALPNMKEKELLEEKKAEEKHESPPVIFEEEKRIEQPLQVQAKMTTPTQENGNPSGLKSSFGGEQNFWAQGVSAEPLRSTFLMSTALITEESRAGKEPIKNPGFGEKGAIESKPVGKLPSPRIEVDGVLQQIIRKIEVAKRYPSAARRRGIEGKAIVRFKLKPQGQVEAIEIVESSGSEILDRASLQTVRDAAPLPYKEGWLKVGIVFKIL